MRRRLYLVLLLLAGLVAIVAAAEAPAEEPTDTPAKVELPRDLDIVERTGKRLVQIDVTVLGPDSIVRDLTAEDFQVVAGGREIEEFVVDRICVDGEAPTVAIPERALVAGKSATSAVSPAPGASYMFYFDQSHLTMVGRQRAIELSRELIDELVTGRNRAMVVSSGRVMRVFAELTSDRDSLLHALDRLNKDPEQYDPFANLEESRVTEVHSALQVGLDAGSAMARIERREAASIRNSAASMPGSASGAMQRQADEFLASANDLKKSGTTHAMTTARLYQKEEKWHTELALARFSTILGRFEGIDSPKAVVYFADRLRSNAGDHYIAMFGRAPGTKLDARDPTGQVLPGGNIPAYDQVIDVAASRGVRLYTVQAEGLVTGTSFASISGAMLPSYSNEALAGTQRFIDAKNGLGGLAAETGGQVFLNGVGPAKIARKIRADLSCVYLISFEPEGLVEDRRIPLMVHVTRPRVEARTRTRLMVESDSARLASRLTTAMTNPERTTDESRLRAVMIPTGFESGQYSALVQVQLSGSDYPNTVWDMGLSCLSQGRLRESEAIRVAVPQPGVPVILESELQFAPGPYELVAVAHDLNQNAVISTRVEGEWPDPADGKATVGPIALVQPSSGIFVRGEGHRPQGAFGRADRDWVRADLPATLLAIVCRDRSHMRTVEVDRRLEGDSIAGFPPLTVDPAKGSCFLIGDTIPADMMTEGAFHYAVSVRYKDDEIASGRREFVAVGADPTAAKPEPKNRR